jgi:hypothetical protein
MRPITVGLLVVLIRLPIAALVVAEAGLWGYVATLQPAYLDQYMRGRSLTGRSVGQLAPDTAGTPNAPQAARVAADVGQWQAWAEGVRRRAAAWRGGRPRLRQLNHDSGHGPDSSARLYSRARELVSAASRFPPTLA